MEISLVVAVAKNWAIGKKNQLPWHLPADLKYFKQLTSNHAIIMGSNTFLSIGKPLSNRTNIVVSSQQNPSWQMDGMVLKNSIADAIKLVEEKNENECFIIGGAKIYEQTIGIATKIYLTEVGINIADADAFFPKIDLSEWQLISSENYLADEKNKMDYSFKVFKKA